MATHVQLVNNVLKRLRESTVTNFDDTEYSNLISVFVNDAKEDIEGQWDWTTLRSNLTFVTVASTSSYSITGSNERTRILRVFNTTQSNTVHRITDDRMDRNLNFNTPVEGIPQQYRQRGIDSSGLLKMDFYPVPDAVYTILLPSVVPQAELAVSSTVITIPSKPVELMAYAIALRERGDAGGTSVAEAVAIANSSIQNAIILDTSYVQEEIVWRQE